MSAGCDCQKSSPPPSPGPRARTFRARAARPGAERTFDGTAYLRTVQWRQGSSAVPLKRTIETFRARQGDSFAPGLATHFTDKELCIGAFHFCFGAFRDRAREEVTRTMPGRSRSPRRSPSPSRGRRRSRSRDAPARDTQGPGPRTAMVEAALWILNLAVGGGSAPSGTHAHEDVPGPAIPDPWRALYSDSRWLQPPRRQTRDVSPETRQPVSPGTRRRSRSRSPRVPPRRSASVGTDDTWASRPPHRVQRARPVPSGSADPGHAPSSRLAMLLEREREQAVAPLAQQPREPPVDLTGAERRDRTILVPAPGRQDWGPRPVGFDFEAVPSPPRRLEDVTVRPPARDADRELTWEERGWLRLSPHEAREHAGVEWHQVYFCRSIDRGVRCEHGQNCHFAHLPQEHELRRAWRVQDRERQGEARRVWWRGATAIMCLPGRDEFALIVRQQPRHADGTVSTGWARVRVPTEARARDPEEAWAQLTAALNGASPAPATSVSLESVYEEYYYGPDGRHTGQIWIHPWVLSGAGATSLPTLAAGYEWVNLREYCTHPKRGATARDMIARMRQAGVWATAANA